MKQLTIGIVAERANVHAETVRCYERRGLITQPAKKEGGYRIYSEDTIARVRFIKRSGAWIHPEGNLGAAFFAG
ncbi:MerR family DNA-binding transcriptional regulator [Desulfoferrobacter suflitae]|jgi:MerR family mercuric resistance operon transcriptional regulator|uniref:MerR family DNA-binding transcriptional regulator n=1 Tax=Desulfoferrobacter suflitae TaxID=2865782 RepID=UPI0021648550|nr:MerR family DNA-binding transcriptional regulator [Desulfoferrobacter suflitae]MCK8604199.1 MerR family DNA-binding transcriptional regulator [Desulfoferrobacter suflitae]